MMVTQPQVIISEGAPRKREAVHAAAHAPVGEPFRLTTAMSADDILAHPALVDGVRSQAQALLQTHRASPRTASPFATQQRWLMAQAALGKYFRNEALKPGSGVLAERFIDAVDGHRLASRNTAAAFIRKC
jgi:hypothetical protein